MQETSLVLTLAAAFAAALVFGYITHRLGLSPIVGYLLAGVVVGPNTPGFIANTHLGEQLAEIGVILLMFGVGLQFHLEELLAVRRIAVPGAITQSGIATVLGAVAAHALGWSWPASIVFGLSLSVASTVVLIRVLSDSNQLHTGAGHIAVGWLVVQDVMTVLVLVLLPTFRESASPYGSRDEHRVGPVKGRRSRRRRRDCRKATHPRMLDRIAATRSRELFTLAVLALAIGLATGSAAVFGVSMALGAFLAGMVVGRSDYSLRAATEALPMRDAFAVLFLRLGGHAAAAVRAARTARVHHHHAGDRHGRQPADGRGSCLAHGLIPLGRP
jgi:CPA2 family monovalent cation:H+ antiporter-2